MATEASSSASSAQAETTRRQSKCNCAVKIRPTAILKVFQLISVIVTFGLFRGVPLTFGELSQKDPNHKVMTTADVFCSGVMVSQFIVTPLLFICHHINKLNIGGSLLEPVIHLVFCLFSLISGFVGLSFWRSPPKDWSDVKAAGVVMFVFCFITAVLYLLDIFVFLRYRRKHPILKLQSSA